MTAIDSIAWDGPLYVNDVQPDEIDEDPVRATVGDARWLSCAHLAQALRSSCNKKGADVELRAAIENDFDVSLDERSPESVSRLKLQGLLP